jgi:hypothetical protein
MWPSRNKLKITSIEDSGNFRLQEDLKNALNITLNEARVLDIEFNHVKNLVGITIEPVALGINGKVPEDNRVQIILKPVGKFIITLRNGNWKDEITKIIKFKPEQISKIFEEVRGCPIYGWEFFNTIETDSGKKEEKPICKYKSKSNNGLANTLAFGSDDTSGKRSIDFKFWFDKLEVFSPSYESITIENFIANGKRGWDSIYGGGEATKQFGIFPMKNK